MREKTEVERLSGGIAELEPAIEAALDRRGEQGVAEGIERAAKIAERGPDGRPYTDDRAFYGRGIAEDIRVYAPRSLSPAPADPPALHVVFDGPPSPDGARFIECEDATGRSVNAGLWREREDGLWELVVTSLPTPPSREGK